MTYVSQIIMLCTLNLRSTIFQFAVVIVELLNHVKLFETPWTVVHQNPLSLGFSRQEHWSELPFLSPGDLPKPGIKPSSSTSPALQADSFLLSHQESMSITSQ